MKLKLIALLFGCSLVVSSAAGFAFAIQRNAEDAAYDKVYEAPPIPMPEIEIEDERYNTPALEYSTFYDERIPMDETTQAEVCYAAQLAGIDPYIAFAVIWQETNFQNVTGDNGDSVGYMQVQPKWHQARMDKLGCHDLTIPYENFIVGCDFLGELLANHSLESSLTYYNSGSYGYSNYAKQVIYKYDTLANGGDVN